MTIDSGTASTTESFLVRLVRTFRWHTAIPDTVVLLRHQGAVYYQRFVGKAASEPTFLRKLCGNMPCREVRQYAAEQKIISSETGRKVLIWIVTADDTYVVSEDWEPIDPREAYFDGCAQATSALRGALLALMRAERNQ